MIDASELGPYSRATISRDERPLLRARYHPIMILVPFIVGAPFMLFALVALIGGIVDSAHTPGMAVFGFVLVCFFGSLCYAFPFLRYRSDEIVVTDRRVILKLGVVARRTRELFFSKIESVDLYQGILGRMLDYGTIIIRGTGGTAQPCKFIREPLRFRATVQDMQERLGHGTPKA
jgi:uncharacterized membrane protein YdbT with pleckstrin-like domain